MNLSSEAFGSGQSYYSSISGFSLMKMPDSKPVMKSDVRENAQREVWTNSETDKKNRREELSYFILFKLYIIYYIWFYFYEFYYYSF